MSNEVERCRDWVSTGFATSRECGKPWTDNPWVFAYTFKVVEP